MKPLGRRPASGVWTFGFKRAEVLPAQANGITLLVVRPPAGCHHVRRKLEHLLCERFTLDHTTLQADHAPDDC